MVLVLLIASIMAFVWRFPAWRLAQTITPGEIIKEAWLADDGRKLVIIANKIRVFDRSNMTELHSFETQPDSEMKLRSFAPEADNPHFTASVISKHHDALAFYDKDGCVSVYSLIDFKRIFQTPPVPDIYAPNRISPNRMSFSEAGKFIVIPVALNKYNAYSLDGSEHKTPLVKAEQSISVVRYFEKPEIVFKTPMYAFVHDNLGFEFYSIKHGWPVFKYPSGKMGWINCALAKDGRAIFANDARGKVAKLDLSGDLPKFFDGKFVHFPMQVDMSNRTVSYSDDSKLPTGIERDLDLLSQTTQLNLATFSRHGYECQRCELAEDGRRVFMRSCLMGEQYFCQFQIFDLKTNTTLFAMFDDGEFDFSTKGNAVISYDRDRLKLYVRDHPEWWWGHFFRVETWLVVLFFGLLMQRWVLNIRERFRKRAS